MKIDKKENWIRNCSNPNCRKELSYAKKSSRDMAEKKNSLCCSCAKSKENHPMYNKKRLLRECAVRWSVVVLAEQPASSSISTLRDRTAYLRISSCTTHASRWVHDCGRSIRWTLIWLSASQIQLSLLR